VSYEEEDTCMPTIANNFYVYTCMPTIGTISTFIDPINVSGTSADT
jgi:hypothetical protein